MNKKILSVLIFISGLMFIVSGISIYNNKNNSIEEHIDIGKINFIYDNTKTIKLNKYETDELGKESDGISFRIKATTNKANINYNITINKDNNNISEDIIRVYLTEIDDDNEIVIYDGNYYNLLKNTDIYKTLYKETISNNLEYTKSFKLRTWIDNKDLEDINDTLITVNVYANSNLNIIDKQ